jgi:hypothetical protein
VTYGELKFRLVKAFPSVDLTLIEGWIGDRYSEILSELPWQRLSVESVLQTVAPYSTGTVDLTADSDTVTGIGTTFTSAMSGRAFRVTGRTELYQFTFVDATTGTLDRPYEGDTDSELGYKIFQYVYPMPADCRMLENNAFSGFTFGPLTRLDRSQMNRSDPAMATFGTPRYWASYMDDASTPPRIQVLLDPIPDEATGIPFSYTADVSVPSQSAAFMAWLEPAALIEGATAKIKRHLKDYVGSETHKREAAEALAGMRRAEAQGLAPAQLQLGSHYTRHRSKRYCR